MGLKQDLIDAKRKALENPDEFKGKYESLFKTFKDELRNSSASTKNIELFLISQLRKYVLYSPY